MLFMQTGPHPQRTEITFRIYIWFVLNRGLHLEIMVPVIYSSGDTQFKICTK